MATRIYAIDPGDNSKGVIEGVGAAASGKSINLTLDIATSIVNEGSGTRVMDRDEVIFALEQIKEHIIRTQWPPA